MSEETEEIGQLAVEIESHLPHLRRIWPNLVTKNVVGREADGKQVRGRTAAHALILHQFLGELEFVLVGERSRTDYVVESGFGAVSAGARSSAERFLARPSTPDSNISRGAW